MKKPRRLRADSIGGAVAAARGSNGNLMPPSHISFDDADWPFWRSVVEEFSREELSAHLLEVAAILARTLCDLDREQKLLRQEGAVMKSEKGALSPNPRNSVVKTLSDTMLSLRRSLALHARARAGEARDVAKRRSINKETAKATSTDDDLIA